MKTKMMAFAALFTLMACGSSAEVGEECIDDGDCAEGLECHSEHEDEHTDEEAAEHEEGKVCADPEDHEDHDH